MNFEEKKKMLLAKKQYDTADLVVLLQVLRDPENGCPWDRIQTHHTIRNDFIEETYEAIEAIDTDNPVLLREEWVMFSCRSHFMRELKRMRDALILKMLWMRFAKN